jgi:hypothetical protein
MKTEVKKSKSWAFEGSPISLDELKKDIAKAEKGLFPFAAESPVSGTPRIVKLCLCTESRNGDSVKKKLLNQKVHIA